MLLEKCEYGSLFEFVRFTKPFQEPLLFKMVDAVTLTLLAARERQIAHLDIKDPNILLARSPD